MDGELDALGEEIDPVRREGAAQANHAIALVGYNRVLFRHATLSYIERRQRGQ